MPDNATVITSWFRSNRGRYFCQGCVSRNTGVTPTAQVNQIVRPPGQSRDWRYASAPCAECGRSRTCVAFLGA